MKTKICSILLASVLLATLTACGGTAASGNSDKAQVAQSGNASQSMEVEEPDTQSDEGLTPFNVTATLDEAVLMDENGVKITATGLSYTAYSVDLELTIENNSGKNLSIVSGSLGYSCNSINGTMINAGYLNCDVCNGKKANDVMSFSYDALMIYGIHEIADMEIGFSIVDDDYNSSYSGPRSLKTSAADTHEYDADCYEQAITSPASMSTYGYEVVYFGKDASYDQNGVKLLSSSIIKNRDGETALLLEFENTTDSMVYLATSDIKLNGLVVNSSIWSNDAINPGKRRIVEVALTSVLDSAYWEEYGITQVESIELSVEQFNPEGATVALETPVKVTIPGVSADFDAEGTELHTSNNLRILSKALREDSGELVLLLLAENTSGKTVTVGDAYNSLSVNGYMTDYSMYSQELEDGEFAALVVRMWSSSLEENHIASASDVQEIEMGFEVKEGYTTIEEPVVTFAATA